jgi:hypothetical protein
MTLLEMKNKVLRLIEEANPNNEKLTDDPDIALKINDVINQVLYELARFKKIPRYIEFEVKNGETIDFERLEKECGSEIYQISAVQGINFQFKADGTVIKVLEDGIAEVECYIYPERINDKTKNNYEFELSADALEIMPYGVACDLLKSDVSTNYGSVYAQRYEEMITRLDSRYGTPSITFKGGVNI